jgi:hypothetical protein
MTEAFTFYDKETGDAIQSGSSDILVGGYSSERAITSFDPFQDVQFSFTRHIPLDFIHDNKNTFDNKFDKSYQSFDDTVEIQVISPCSKKPRALSPTHFYTSCEMFSEIRTKIEMCLNNRPELVFSFFSDKQVVGD